MPCGHCRQFMNEVAAAPALQLVVGDGRWALADLLPVAFGPKDIPGGYAIGERPPLPPLLVQQLDSAADPDLVAAAAEAARRSHAPHTGRRAGAALAADVGGRRVYVAGAYLENAAYNPSLPPLQAALVAWVAEFGDRPFADILAAVVVEELPAAGAVTFSHAPAAASLLLALAPQATVTVHEFTVPV
jgi:cytidine deaminase